ncbi:MAG: uroporphyrinogen decarboxylase family protein [Sedimentisphaeraceae bacterium JB056]
MNRRQRLLATFSGKPVDRPPVSFYEIGSFKYDPDDPDEFNVHNDPSWRELLELAEEKTDIIRLIGAKNNDLVNESQKKFLKVEKWREGDSKYVKNTVSICGREITELMRRDTDTDTVWKLEHYIKNLDDLKAFLELPFEIFDYAYDCDALLASEKELGDSGIAGFDTADPLCRAADLFSMEDFTIFAMTEKELFHQLLQKFSEIIYPAVEKAVDQCPGRLWRIYGPEYATEPYLPPALFDEYAAAYDKPIIDMIHKGNGFARIHAHGRLKNVLPFIAEMGADGLDPIEPPIQGDVELEYVREKYGENLVLFGNLEITDIENLESQEFEDKVHTALQQGTSGNGRGFVLMPSASPYGRIITNRTMANYQTIIRFVENWN